MKITHTADVNAMRRAAYPPLADFADALYWQSKGDSSKLDTYLEAIEEVKRRFPKEQADPHASEHA